ncbi:MAG TPA: CvpA family protein [Pseudohaliea sp.]|nr:CvpA family protein [Pseudohaliea sp.]
MVSGWPAISAFNGFDWTVVVIVTLSALVSLWRGFSREALSLAGWVIAFVLANLFATRLSTVLAGTIENPTGRYIVAWTLVFVAVLLLAGLAARVFARLVRASGLGLLDRLLGSVFGMLRGLLIVIVLLFLLRQLVPPAEQQWLHQSQLVPQLDPLLDWSLRAFDDARAGRFPALTT